MPKKFLQSPFTFFLSSQFPGVILADSTSPLVSQVMWSLNPKNQPIVDFPRRARFLKTLFEKIFLLWQIGSGDASIKLTPEQDPSEKWSKQFRGTVALALSPRIYCSSASLENPSCDGFEYIDRSSKHFTKGLKPNQKC
ncbi:MAG: hypothetical protein V9E95_13625 [Methanothrix soehngenii]